MPMTRLDHVLSSPAVESQVLVLPRFHFQTGVSSGNISQHAIPVGFTKAVKIRLQREICEL